MDNTFRIAKSSTSRGTTTVRTHTVAERKRQFRSGYLSRICSSPKSCGTAVCVSSTDQKKMDWIIVCLGDTQFGRQTITDDNEEDELPNAQKIPQTPPRNDDDRPTDLANWSNGQPSAFENRLAPRNLLLHCFPTKKRTILRPQLEHHISS